MNRSLAISTAAPRNATGENQQTSYSLAEDSSGRRDATSPNSRDAHCQKLSPMDEKKYSAGREGGGNIFLRSPNPYEEILPMVMEVET